MSLRRFVPLLVLPLACTPYNLDGDFYSGPIDPKPFPAAYQGAGFDPVGGNGTIAPIPATGFGGAPAAYYSFPVPAVAGFDPLRLRTEVMGATPSVKERALAYVFDGDDAHDSKKCTPPANYTFDIRRDFVRFDQEGNVFQERQGGKGAAALPSDTAYAPIYAEVPVTSGGEPCQSVHSSEGLVDNRAVTVEKVPPPAGTTLHPTGKPDGKYLAMAIVDPAANVLNPDGSLDPNTALGPQRFGWFNHFLVAYLEGGYVPTTMTVIPGTMGAPDQVATVATPMTLFAPNAFPLMGAVTMCNVANPIDPAAPCAGNGFDVLGGIGGKSGLRGGDGYSPICRVRTFTPADPMNPPTDPALIDPATLDPDSQTFVYCLQVTR